MAKLKPRQIPRRPRRRARILRVFISRFSSRQPGHENSKKRHNHRVLCLIDRKDDRVTRARENVFRKMKRAGPLVGAI